MSNLLEFQRTILTKGKAIYSIDTGELNPVDLNLTENKETVTLIPKEDYSIRKLREFIQENSIVLATNGDVLQGELVNGKVILTVLNKIN